MHPQSRVALLALKDNLQREELARGRVMELIQLKCEFLDLQFAHRLRRTGLPIRQFYSTIKPTRLLPCYSVHRP